MRRTFAIAALLVALAGPVEAQDYYKGVGALLRGDYAAALRQWRPLAERGHAFAQSSLGLLYEEGRGVPRDYREAVRWYRKAAEQGNSDGQFNLGTMYLHGRGVPQDDVRAHMWFSLAAARGDKVAARTLDRIAERMTRAQISEARTLARAWTSRREKRP